MPRLIFSIWTANSFHLQFVFSAPSERKHSFILYYHGNKINQCMALANLRRCRDVNNSFPSGYSHCVLERKKHQKNDDVTSEIVDSHAHTDTSLSCSIAYKLQTFALLHLPAKNVAGGQKMLRSICIITFSFIFSVP